MRKFVTVSLCIAVLLCFHLFHRLGHRHACACEGVAACGNAAVVQQAVVAPVAVQSYAVPSVAVLATPTVVSYAPPVVVEQQVVEVRNVHHHAQNVRVRSRGNRVNVSVR